MYFQYNTSTLCYLLICKHPIKKIALFKPYCREYHDTNRSELENKSQTLCLTLYMSGRQDSNLRPPGPKPGALPACATSRFYYLLSLTKCPAKAGPLSILMQYSHNKTAVREGFEPSVQFNPYGSLANY